MKTLKEAVLPKIAVFLLTAFGCALLLVLTALIPKEAIKENCKKSAEFFYEKDLFPYIVENQFNTKQDNYADTILVNIMYHIREENLLFSLVESSYYQGEEENVNVRFWKAVQEEKEPNVEYFRYWHGMMIFLRPLFLFTDIQGVRGILGIFLGILTLITCGFLIKKQEKALGISFLLGNILIQSWMCAMSIEYISTFLVMNTVTIITIFLCDKYKNNREELNKKIGLLMCGSGVVTCFLDFLTTETLTVTIPLFIALVFTYRNQQLGEVKREILGLFSRGMIWAISYGAMFFLKWGLASVFLGKEAFQKAVESAGVRMVGAVTLGNTNLDPQATFLQRLLGALGRNQGSLFPFREEMKMGIAILLFIGVVFLWFSVIYLFRGKNFSGKMIFLSLILGIVPYLRYMVLANHAYIHYFFTYRAQLIVAVVILFTSWEFGLKNLIKNK